MSVEQKNPIKRLKKTHTTKDKQRYKDDEKNIQIRKGIANTEAAIHRFHRNTLCSVLNELGLYCVCFCSNDFFCLLFI